MKEVLRCQLTKTKHREPGIHETYTLKQRAWLYSVKMFLEEVKEKQKFYERKQI